MRISIVIPCHNAASYLAQTVGAVLDQGRPAHEIIIVDDASTDGSLAIARRLAARCAGRLHVVAEPSGQAPRTRNIGAALASGDALMFLDADDLLGPDALAALAASLESHPGAVASIPWRRLERVDGRWLERPASCAPRRPGQDALAAWLTGWYCPPCAVLWSREAFARTGGWDEGAVINQDGDLMMRALVEGVPLVEASEGLSFYRRAPPGTASLSGWRATRAGLAGRLAIVARIASRLEAQDRLTPYRSAIAEALAAIGADATHDHPDLAARARELARWHGPSALQRLRTGAAALRQRIGRARLMPPPPPRQPPDEIRFGLDRARRLLHAPPADDGPPPRRHTPPAVSVVIPTHKRPHLLHRALDSVRAQDFADFEVLVVDDGQCDATAQVVATFADPRIRYLRQPENRGVAAARNRGLREARGHFIAFLDDDDEWLPGKLARQVALLRAAPADVGLVYTGVETVHPDGTRTVESATARGDLHRRLLVSNVIHGGGSNVMLRRQVIAAAGFFDERLPAIEDFDYWLRISREFRIEAIPDPLIRYRDDRRPEIDKAADALRRSRNAAANVAAREQFYRKHRAEMRRTGTAHLFLLETARRHLAGPLHDIGGARRLALRAACHAPLSLPTLRRLATLWAPPGLGRLLHLARHHLPLPMPGEGNRG
jgi:glycosyltransferase involved in cell wall biosynthesis